MNSEEVKMTSHKGEKRKDFTMEFKRNAIFLQKKTATKPLLRSFPLNEKKKREWRKNKPKLFDSAVKASSKRLGVKPMDVQLEN